MISIKVHLNIGMRPSPFAVIVPGDVAKSLTRGDDISIYAPESERRICEGTAIDAWCGPVNLIPSSMLEEHHDPVCRTYSGMLLTLRIAYGMDVEKQHVSVITLRPKTSAIRRI